MLTGCTGRAHGHFDNASTLLDEGLPTFPRVFSENGWRTAAIGKCHFTPVTAHHGYDELQLMEEIPEHIEDDAYLQYLQDKGHPDLRNIHGIRPLLYHVPQPALVPEQDLGPFWLANRAQDWITKNSDRPFLLTLGWIKPHPPWNIPASKKGIYKDADLPEPKERSRDLPYPPQESDLYGDLDSKDEKRKIREAYFESITMIDEAFGQVFQTLEKEGILENTMIIFTSDHGEMLQDKGFYQKALPYDSACRVPLIVRYPEKFTPGSVRSDFVDLLDIFPTLLDVADISLDYKPAYANARIEGESLLISERDRRQVQYAHSGKGKYRWVMTRNKRYKFIHFFAGGLEYLYDMENDPCEKNNLIGQPDCPGDVHEALKAEAVRREELCGPEGSILNGTFADEEATPFPAFDWNNGEKFPRWCFQPDHFQHFGRKPPKEESALFTEEFSICQRSLPADVPLETKEALLQGFIDAWDIDFSPLRAQLEKTSLPDNNSSIQ
jgi:arylsulfatase A-like enzyme